MNAGSEQALTALRGPILVLTENDRIASGAIHWAKVFGAAGLVHRVRLVGGGETDIPEVMSEAASLGAVTILAVGTGCPLAVGQAAAERLRLPLARIS